MYSMRDKSDTKLSLDTAPDRDLDWSLDAYVPTSIDTTMESRNSQSLSPQERQIISTTDPQASSNDDIHTTLQEDTNSQELTLSLTHSPNTADTVHAINDLTENSGSQEVTEGTSRNHSQELTDITSQSLHSLQEVTGTGPPDAQKEASQELTHSFDTLNAEQKYILLNPDLAQQDATQLSEQENLSLQDVTNINTPQADTDSETIIMEPELPIVPPQTMSDTEVVVDTPKNKRIQQQLSSLGLPLDVFNVNKNRYFLAESVHDQDIDYLHFTDIMDRSVLVIVANLSQEDISFEKEQLKTSSPISSSSTQTDMTTNETDSEKHDPTYGRSKPAKISMRPRRAPSAS